MILVNLKKVCFNDRELLWNINQKYLYEMTNFYDDPMDLNGNYHYGYFDDYFKDDNRVAYFIYNDETLIGFAMLCPYSYIGKSPDYVLAEFTIFPTFRRHHYAMDAIKLIFDKHPGSWEIKYNEKNIKAKNLWQKVVKPYNPQIVHLSEEETVFVFSTR